MWRIGRVPGRMAAASALALIALLGAGAWHLTRATGVVLTGTVGLCSPGLAIDHPGACNAIRLHPGLLLVGPGGASGPRSHVVTVRAAHDRTFRVTVPRGGYDVFVVAGTSLIAARSEPVSVGRDRAHDRLGSVAPADPWKWSGSVHVGSPDGRM